MCPRRVFVGVLFALSGVALASSPATAQGDDATSAAGLRTTDDLRLDVVLSDPLIAQPLQISFDERGRLWLVEYRQYPFPAGLRVVSRDNFWRVVYDKQPLPPPRGDKGKDRITIHEDTDGDGAYDAHKTFIDGLNIATSLAFGDGGVWVLNPPFLLFYPDQNHDDVPDGEPEVHLRGFGLEDTHSCANSLQLGPDGWLYACQGSTVSGDIIRPGLDDKPVHSLGQLIWRYHPRERRYEIFAEGGGNAFGLEIDSVGRVFSGHNGGDTRGFHYMQGSYSQKGFNKHGPLSNPFAFGYFPAMRHHAVPRFTHSFILYEAAGLPEPYRGHLFGVEPLQGTVVESRIFPDGSTFQTADVQRVISGEQVDFRPVDIKVGPTGAIYVADWRDANVNHLKGSEGEVQRETGRVFRLAARGASPAPARDLSAMSALELVEHLKADDKWTRRTAARLLAHRREGTVAPRLRELLVSESGQAALEALWALNLLGMLDDSIVTAALAHENPYVRLWAVRLACDDRQVSQALAEQFAELAQRENNVEVRGQLACSARRLPAGQAMAVVRQLLAHDEDVNDPCVPLLIWWAIETHCQQDREMVLRMCQESAFWEAAMVKSHLASRLMRRFAQAGTRNDLLTCAALLKLAPTSEDAKRLLAGFEEAFAGRSLSALPDELAAALAASGQASLALRVRQRDADAIAMGLARLGDSHTDIEERRELARMFGEVAVPSAIPRLLVLAKAEDAELRQAAIGALQLYDSADIPLAVLEALPALPPDTRPMALSVLTSRAAWSRMLLEQVTAGKLAADEIPMSVVNHILLQGDDRNTELAKSVWGDTAAAAAEEIQAETSRLRQAIHDGNGSPYDGRKLFNQHCAKCHKLYDHGGDIGPDLTAYQRDNVDRMLASVVNPSAEIREGFENFLLQTTDGRTLTGFLADQDNQVVVLRTAEGQNVAVPRDEIEELRATGQSLMPEGLLKQLTDSQARDLFAYLRGTQPLAVDD